MKETTMVTMIALVTVMSGGKKIHPDDDINTFECSEAEAEKLIRIGAAKPVEGTVAEDNSGSGAKDPLLEMKVDELKALAEQRGVTIPEGVKLKADIIAFLNSPDGAGEA